MLDEVTRNAVLDAQRNEITEHFIYAKLAGSVDDEHNVAVLARISREEKEHYKFWRKHSGEDVAPDTIKIWFYYLVARILGITFGIKLMERGESHAQVVYEEISKVIPEAKKIEHDEHQHELSLIDMIEEERLKYIGSIVLGLSDALVELTGTLAGLTFALQNARLTAMTGLITGIAGSLSMAASVYLSTSTEEGEQNAGRAAWFTGAAYVFTVVLLIAPYLLLTNHFLALAMTMLNAVAIILAFTFYVSVAKDLPFWKRFVDMTGICLGVAVLSFVIGALVRSVLGIEL